MRPPLRFGEEMDVYTLGRETYVGWFPDLSKEDHRSALARALQLRHLATPTADGSNDLGQYWLSTHGVEGSDPNDDGGSIQQIRCSCAFLVEYCYERTKVDLVEKDSLPLYSDVELKETFCREIPIPMHRLKYLLESWGLTGNGPWPVLLPAYQMKAFLKTRDQLPHVAQKADHPWV